MNNPRSNIAISCECGWVGIATSFSAAASEHLLHQLSKGEGHSAITHTNVVEKMGHPEFSILRQVASQDAMDHRAKRMVRGREEYRLRRKEDSPLYVEPEDDGLGCFRGMWTAAKIYLGALAGAAVVYWVVRVW